MAMDSSWRDLTELEQQLLRFLADDFTHTEIARQLPKKNDPNQRYSAHYIAHRLSDLYKKIGVYGKAGAVDWYHKNNQVENNQVENNPIEALISTISKNGNRDGDAEEANGKLGVVVQAEWLSSIDRSSVTDQAEMDGVFPHPILDRQQLEDSSETIHKTFTILLLIWGIFSLLFLGILFYRASQSPSATADQFPVLDMNFIVPLLIGLYGLFHCKEIKSAIHPAIRTGYLLVSIATLFWVLGDAIWNIQVWVGGQPYTEATFGLSGALAYIPHHLCLLAAAYLIWRQRDSLLSQTTVEAATIQTSPFLFYLCLWLLLNIATITGFYLWHAGALKLYECYYALLDSTTLLFLAHAVHTLVSSPQSESTRPILRSLSYLLAAIVLWWVWDIAFAISVSLQQSNLLAYHNVEWVDILIYTALLLQGFALFLLPTSSSALLHTLQHPNTSNGTHLALDRHSKTM